MTKEKESANTVMDKKVMCLDLIALLDKYIMDGIGLLELLVSVHLRKVDRIESLRKKLEGEIQFLRKVKEQIHKSPETVKKEHIVCSNMLNIIKHVEFLQSGIKPCSVLKPFHFINKYNTKQKIVIDIVANDGQEWFKVIARNPMSLHRASLGDCEFGQRSTFSQAEDYITCSKQNPVKYQQPKVSFVFTSGITLQLAKKLEAMGIEIVGDRLDLGDGDVTNYESDSDSDSSAGLVCEDRMEENGHIKECEVLQCVLCQGDSSRLRKCLQRVSFDFDSYEKELQNDPCPCVAASENRENCLNVDITAMVVFVSSLTNGENRFRFKDKIIAEQAMWESQRPAKKLLDQICKGKQLIACERAVRDFVDIVATIGGDGERQRACELLATMLFVKDDPSGNAMQLRCTGSISERGKLVFGTGDKLRIVTLTANTGFIRSALSQGLQFAIIGHEPRVLTEKKEETADLI